MRYIRVRRNPYIAVFLNLTATYKSFNLRRMATGTTILKRAPLPKGHETVLFCIKLPVVWRDAIKRIAESKGMVMSAYAREILRKELRKTGTPSA